MEFRYVLFAVLLTALLSDTVSAARTKPKTTKGPPSTTATITTISSTTTSTTTTSTTTTTTMAPTSTTKKSVSTAATSTTTTTKSPTTPQNSSTVVNPKKASAKARSAWIGNGYQFFDLDLFYQSYHRYLLKGCRRRFHRYHHFYPIKFCNPPPLFNHLPEKFDLRNMGTITKIGNESYDLCRATWAYGPTTTFESALLEEHTTLDPDHFRLSRQDLIDCAGRQGCRGGIDVTQAFEFMQKYGQEKNQKYIYTGKKGKCRHNFRRKHYRIRDWCAICPTSVHILQRYLYRYRTALTTILQIRDFKAFRKIGEETVTKDEGREVTKVLVGNLIGWKKDPETNRTTWLVRVNLNDRWGMGGDAWIDAHSNIYHILDYNFIARVRKPNFPPETFFDFLLEAF